MGVEKVTVLETFMKARFIKFESNKYHKNTPMHIIFFHLVLTFALLKIHFAHF